MQSTNTCRLQVRHDRQSVSEGDPPQYVLECTVCPLSDFYVVNVIQSLCTLLMFNRFLHIAKVTWYTDALHDTLTFILLENFLYLFKAQGFVTIFFFIPRLTTLKTTNLKCQIFIQHFFKIVLYCNLYLKYVAVLTWGRFDGGQFDCGRIDWKSNTA